MKIYRKTLMAGLIAVSLVFCLVLSATAEPLEWPKQWTVFAPVDRDDPVLESEVLDSIPESITLPPFGDLPERTSPAQVLEVEPGQAMDLVDLFDAQAVGNTAYIFLELESPVAQTVTLGMGGDWWLEAWINGEPLLDTLERGNLEFPPTILDHQAEAQLEEGTNVLAVRFITGGASSLLALGGPAEFPAAEAKAAKLRAARELNIFPEDFEDRLRFPVEDQALAMARRGLHFPQTDADLAEGALVGLQPMPERQLVFRALTKKSGEVVDTISRRFDEPVALLISRESYPWEDRHLDAIVWLTPADEDTEPQGSLEVILKDAGGEVLARHGVDELSPSGLFFSVGFPEALKDSGGTLEVIWNDGEEEKGRAEAAFLVEAPAELADSGRIPLRILNQPGATLAGAPMTVGVPFPRGALSDENRLRLVDESGDEIPLQTMTMAKWSRFGPVKWLLCDFSIDLEGEPREVFLEFGPDITRAVHSNLETGGLQGGFPALNAGRIRIDAEGLAFDVDGTGNFQPVLAPEAMHGALVSHEDGRTYTMPADAEYSFEELGSEKAVVLRTGWYHDGETEEPFCQFVTRLVFHRNSPVIRIFHTWIFTGDGNQDRIADMGWRFDAVSEMEKGAFLTDFEEGEWVSDQALVQFDFETFLLPGVAEEREGRTPGVLTGKIDDTRVMFGAKDFWQNFPSELEIDEGGFSFYNWPRHNPPERLERPVSRDDAFRHRFVHEGEVLDFRLPEEYTKGEIWEESSSREGHIAEDRPESVNAQGIARTEEMFLYFADESVTADDAARVVQGLNDESLRAVADPKWVAASGVFGDIHHRDPENFAEDERIYEEVALAPARWVERLGFYGMWLHGDYPTWSLRLDEGTVSTYRTLRKNHHTFPYRWVPYVRSGDPRLLKLAQSAVRQMTDANFCHYATEEIDATVGPSHFRRQGWWDRNLLPWAGRQGPHLRSYTVDSDYLWDAYYVTGYARARDVALLFGELTQHDYVAPSLRHTASSGIRARFTESLLFSYVHMFEATFDPWFLSAAYEVAKLHAHLYADTEVDPLTARPDEAGSFWRGADQAFYRLARSEEARRTALNNAKAWGSPRSSHARTGGQAQWGARRTGAAPFAWIETGDDFYLRRAAASLDAGRMVFYEGDLDYFRGSTLPMNHGIFAMAWMAGMPRAQAVLARAGEFPEPIPDSREIGPAWLDRDDEEFYHWQSPFMSVRKASDEPVSVFLDQRGMAQEAECEMIGPDGEVYLVENWLAPGQLEIAADAPEGVYQIHIRGSFAYPEGVDRSRFRRSQGAVYFPLTEPDTKEVMVLERTEAGTRVPGAESGWWFWVPDGTDEFWVEFPSGQHGRRISVWNPDGERAWDGNLTDDSQRVQMDVPTESAGQLWRVTGSAFDIDPVVPPYFSVSPSKWFDPDAVK